MIEARKPEVIEGLRNGTILGASTFLNLDYTDTRTGQRAGSCLLHVAATNRPYLTELEPYEETASASPGREVLMLTAASAPAAMPSREYATMPQTLVVTWDDLDARIARFAYLSSV